VPRRARYQPATGLGPDLAGRLPDKVLDAWARAPVT
jgi:hypothetical protein